MMEATFAGQLEQVRVLYDDCTVCMILGDVDVVESIG